MDKEGISWEFLVNSQKGIANLRQIDGEFDKLKKSAKQVEGQVVDSVGKMDTKMSKFKMGVTSLAGEFPLLGNAIRLATSPLGLLTIGLVGVTAAFSHGAQKAKEFDNTFLEVKNLNLDKTNSQMEKLRNNILNTSFDKGLDPDKFARGMFDVQSATGKYGDEVVDIVQKIGVFSRTMKSDFNETINGASKAMGIFKFGADGLDDYLASSAKVVQLGITTFDQLAKVQTEFAGAAAASGQGYDEANKVFSVFTKTTKNVDIAATMTKGFFEDLKKLEKIKVKVFENGEFRKTDDILKDVNDKFKSLDNESISNLIEQIGGNEGLRGLLKQVQANGDDVLKLFKDFDNQEFDFDEALKNANGDLVLMDEIVNNKLTAAWIRLGETITPIFISIKSALADMMDWFTDIPAAFSKIKGFDIDIAGKNKSDAGLEHLQSKLDAISDPQQKEAYLDGLIKMETNKLEKNKADFQDYMNNSAIYSKEKGFKESEGFGITKSIEDIKKQGVVGYDRWKIQTEMKSQEMLINEMLGLKRGLTEGGTILDEDPNKQSITGSKTADDSIKGISVAGAAVRHVTVNIENLIRENIINASNAQNGMMMTADEITQIIVRAVRDAELTLSSNG